MPVVQATAAGVAAMERLNSVVAAADRAGPDHGALMRLRSRLVAAAKDLRQLAVGIRRLADAGSHRAEWTTTAAESADEAARRFAAVLERQASADGADDDEAPGPHVESAADLGAILGKEAFREQCQAQGMRAAAVALLLAIAGLAWSILWRAPSDTGSLVIDLAKLATAVPLALLVNYLQREATLHRASAARLGELRIQLLHVDRFFADEEQRRERRAEIWQRWALGLPIADAGPTVSNDLAAILERIAELVKSVGSLGRG
jgi:hypothetical protein